MWPILVGLYYRLARREEGYMLEQFGERYAEYQRKTGMFLPRRPSLRRKRSVLMPSE